jgi:hypothetical protein
MLFISFFGSLAIHPMLLYGGKQTLTEQYSYMGVAS